MKLSELLFLSPPKGLEVTIYNAEGDLDLGRVGLSESGLVDSTKVRLSLWDQRIKMIIPTEVEDFEIESKDLAKGMFAIEARAIQVVGRLAGAQLSHTSFGGEARLRFLCREKVSIPYRGPEKDCDLPYDWEKPDWESYDAAWKHVHDWKTYLGQELREKWEDIPDSIKKMIVTSCRLSASNEHWD